MEKQKSNKKINVVLIISIIILISLAGYIVNDKVIKPYYQEQGAYLLAREINSNGKIPLINSQGNITWISIQEICLNIGVR